MSANEDKFETAREDLIVGVIAFIGALLTAGSIGAVVWYDLDKFLAVIGFTAIWGGFGIALYAIKSRLW